MLTLHTLPKREVFDMTDEQCPALQDEIERAIIEAKTQTIH